LFVRIEVFLLYAKIEREDPLYSAVNGSRAIFLALLIAKVSCL